jgi:hypothetical protein
MDLGIKRLCRVKMVDKFILYQLIVVNEVLWITPPAMSQALLAYGGIDYGFGGGFASRWVV